MKSYRLAVLVAIAAALGFNTAVASERGSPLTGGGTGIGVGVGVGVGGAGGNSSTVVNGDDYHQILQIPNTPPAISPNVSMNVICPMVAIGSNAISLPIFSISGTQEPKVVALCVAYHLGQAAIVEQMLCGMSAQYKAANGNCAAVVKPIAKTADVSNTQAERQAKWKLNQEAKARGDVVPYQQEHFQ